MTFRMTDAQHLNEEQLSALLDAASAADSQPDAEHLAACDRCQTELEGLRSTVALLRSLPAVEPPRSFRLEAPPRPTRLPRLVLWTRGLGALAAGLFVVLISLDLLVSPGSGGVASPTSAPLAQPVAATAGPQAQRALELARAPTPAGPPTSLPAAPRPEGATQSQPRVAPGDSARASSAAAEAPRAAPPAAPAAERGAPALAEPAAAPARPQPTLERPPATAGPPASAPLAAQPTPVAPVPAAAPVLPVAEPLVAAERGSPLRPWQVASGLLAVALIAAALLLGRRARPGR
jgi:hypothetical protein